MVTPTTWTVAFRLGTSIDFLWVRSQDFIEYEEAHGLCDWLITRGNLAYVCKARVLDHIGLPETFSTDTLNDISR